MNRGRAKRALSAGLASSRRINLNDLLAGSFFQAAGTREDFFLPVSEIAVSPAQRLLMPAFSRLSLPALLSAAALPSRPSVRPLLRHSSLDVLL